MTPQEAADAVEPLITELHYLGWDISPVRDLQDCVRRATAEPGDLASLADSAACRAGEWYDLAAADEINALIAAARAHRCAPPSAATAPQEPSSWPWDPEPFVEAVDALQAKVIEHCGDSESYIGTQGSETIEDACRELVAAAEKARDLMPEPFVTRVPVAPPAEGAAEGEPTLPWALTRIADLSVELERAGRPEIVTEGEHRYLSTGCLHGEHAYCQAMTGQQGEKRPGRCKFCDAQCVCDCHAEPAPPAALGDTVTTADELDRLPIGTVVRAPAGGIAVKDAHGWDIAGMAQIDRYRLPLAWLPARVLDLPEETS